MRNPLTVLLLFITFAGIAVPAGASDAGGSPTVVSAPFVRPKPSPRPYRNPYGIADQAGIRGSGSLAEPAPDPADVIPIASGVERVDDPVLWWLPEISAASVSTGTPRSLIAGIMQLESSGDPETISVAGAQGLMQVMPAEFNAKAIPSELWQDPATNIMIGARILAERSGAGWEGAVAYYFGIGCDAYGTCTHQYATIVLGWANYYAAVLGDPIWYDVGRIPVDPPTPESALTAAPVTPTSTATAISVTDVPTQETIVATETPMSAISPTLEATVEPTQDINQIPTEPALEPSQAPTEEPVFSEGEADGVTTLLVNETE